MAENKKTKADKKREKAKNILQEIRKKYQNEVLTTKKRNGMKSDITALRKKRKKRKIIAWIAGSLGTLVVALSTVGIIISSQKESNPENNRSIRVGAAKDPDAGRKDVITAQVKDRAALAQEVKGMVAPYVNEAIDNATNNADFMNQINKDLVSMGYIKPFEDSGPTIKTKGFKKFCEETGIKLTTEKGKVVLNDQNKKAIRQGIIQARMPKILKTLGYTKDNISVKDVYNSDAFKKFCDETGFNKDNISTENLNNALDTWKKQNPQASTAQKPKGAEMKEMLAGATVTELPNGLTLYQAKGRGGMGA